MENKKLYLNSFSSNNSTLVLQTITYLKITYSHVNNAPLVLCDIHSEMHNLCHTPEKTRETGLLFQSPLKNFMEFFQVKDLTILWESQNLGGLSKRSKSSKIFLGGNWSCGNFILSFSTISHYQRNCSCVILLNFRSGDKMIKSRNTRGMSSSRPAQDTQEDMCAHEHIHTHTLEAHRILETTGI